MIATYYPMIRFYELNPLSALTLPLSAVFYMAATIHSALSSGRAVWRVERPGARPGR